MRGWEARLRGKTSGRLGLWAPPSPPPPLPPRRALPRTCAGLPPSPGGSRRALLGVQRTRRSWAQGAGAGNFPPRLPGPAPLPLPRQVGGHRWGNSIAQRARAGGPGERRRRRGGDRLGPGAQLPSSPDTSCPCLSRAERPPFQPVGRVRGLRVTLPEAGGVGTREGRGVKIQRRCACERLTMNGD